MKNTTILAASEDSALIVEGGASAALVTLLQTAVLRMIPYAVPGLALVLLDLMYGIRAAKARGEAVRLSTAIRRSLTIAATTKDYISVAGNSLRGTYNVVTATHRQVENNI